MNKLLTMRGARNAIYRLAQDIINQYYNNNTRHFPLRSKQALISAVQGYITN